MDEIRCKIELREDENRLGPGRIYGVLMAYSERASDRAEVFEPGSLSWPESGIVINRQHLRQSPILRCVPVVDGNEVKIDSPLPDTTAGRDCAAEVRSKLMTGMSIEFRALKETFVGGVRRISEAVLSAAAVVDAPSFAGSTVEVRAKPRQKRRQIWL